MACILKMLLSVIMMLRQHTVSLLWAAVPNLILACLCFAVSSGTTLGLRCFSLLSESALDCVDTDLQGKLLLNFGCNSSSCCSRFALLLLCCCKNNMNILEIIIAGSGATLLTNMSASKTI